ncbi:MAG: hypothetical protein WC796_00370 [Candidatus Pacearchaeota archaeon]|jgi:hypothetical protein
MKTQKQLEIEKESLEMQYGSVRELAGRTMPREMGMFASICGFNKTSLNYL